MHQNQRLLNLMTTCFFSTYLTRMIVLTTTLGMLLVSNISSAATDPTCPSDHQMYYVGTKAIPNAKTPDNLSWTEGTTSKEFNFDDGIKLKLAFTKIIHLRPTYPSPKFESYLNATNNAINMFHSSQKADVNHKLTGTVLNSPVSKYGFVVQDLDSNESSRYIESLSLATSGGSFTNLKTGYFERSNSNQTVSGKGWNNCNTNNSCDFNVSWGAKPVNTPFSVTHGNTYASAPTTGSYGDHLVGYSDFYFCVAPSQYTFSGTVFNDNGGLSGSPKNDLTNSFVNTYKYFNGVFDNGESGIDSSALNNLKVRLTDCNSTDITGTTPKNVSDNGSYSFTVPASAVAGKSQVCLIQEEPDPWSYSVDTTPNRLEVPINNSVYLYEDNNFGEVIAEQTALVLKKYQYVHQCDANLNYNNILDKDSPLNGFSINAPRQDEKVDPGQCIAYKIEAYNHGHITLTDIRITDILQKTPVESVFHLPNSSGIAASLRTTDNPTSGLVNIGDNGVIITEPFKLTNTATTTTVSKRTLYFNTKYGN